MPKACSVEGCNKPHRSKGYCLTHYVRFRKYGNTSEVRKTGPKPAPPEERFWAKVSKTDKCWLWTGSQQGEGYGKFCLDARKSPVQAHRYSIALFLGVDIAELPADKVVDHICQNPNCVKPEHLRLVTQQQNTFHKRTGTTTSRTGFRNVRRSISGKFYAQVVLDGIRHYGDRMNTPEEAYEQAIKMKKNLHGAEFVKE